AFSFTPFFHPSTPVSSCKMLAVHFDKLGGPENLYVKEVTKPSLGEGEVLLRVVVSALNHADFLQTGQYSLPPEASNIATFWASRHMAKLGPGCQGHWKIGDAAMALPPGGGQAQYVTVPEGLLVPIPEGLTLPQAAAIPEASWLTTFQLLRYMGGVQDGETMLIHASMGGVGTAVIQPTRLFNAVPTGDHELQGEHSNGTEAERLGAAAGFDYKKEGFSEGALKATQGVCVGVNAILDCIDGSYWEKNLHCLAADGSLWGSLLRSRDQKYKEMLVKTFMEQVLAHFSPGSAVQLQPVIDKVFTMAEIQKAHFHMEANQNVVRIILEMP
uniref:Enoyl reductase (ER) domain-containing protein n=1 Tax=Piliocolobus tephrosceles TaxID=591936 RepID=A0A8C9M0A1_9PRIM